MYGLRAEFGFKICHVNKFFVIKKKKNLIRDKGPTIAIVIN